jgi:hypothetical protein
VRELSDSVQRVATFHRQATNVPGRALKVKRTSKAPREL